MAYAESGDYTAFTYDVDKIYRRVRTRTVTRLKMLRDGTTGERIYDELGLTEMEENDFSIIYPHVASEIFVLIQSLCQGVDDAFAWDATEITFIAELPTYWDPNKTPIFDLQMMNLFELWISREWFKQIGVPAIAQEYDLLVDQASKQLRSSVLSRTVREQRTYRSL